MHRYLEDTCKSLHGRSNILSKRITVLIILIHNHLYKSIEESDQHHHGRASSPHQRQGHSRQGPPPPHRACRAPPPPSTGYRARGEEESKPEILENKNRAQSCPIDSPASLLQACTPGPLCTALTPPGFSGSPGLPAGTSLSPARPCVGRTANLPEKIKICMESCSPLTSPPQICPTSLGKGGQTAGGPPSVTGWGLQWTAHRVGHQDHLHSPWALHRQVQHHPSRPAHNRDRPPPGAKQGGPGR